MAKAQYKTKQMTELLAFLQSVEGSHVTVHDICDYFEAKGIAVGTTRLFIAIWKKCQRRCGCQICGRRSKQCLL